MRKGDSQYLRACARTAQHCRRSSVAPVHTSASDIYLPLETAKVSTRQLPAASLVAIYAGGTACPDGTRSAALATPATRSRRRAAAAAAVVALGIPCRHRSPEGGCGAGRRRRVGPPCGCPRPPPPCLRRRWSHQPPAQTRLLWGWPAPPPPRGRPLTSVRRRWRHRRRRGGRGGRRRQTRNLLADGGGGGGWRAARDWSAIAEQAAAATRERRCRRRCCLRHRVLALAWFLAPHSPFHRPLPGRRCRRLHSLAGAPRSPLAGSYLLTRGN